MKNTEYTFNEQALITPILRRYMTTDDWIEYLNYQGPIFMKSKNYQEFPE